MTLSKGGEGRGEGGKGREGFLRRSKIRQYLHFQKPAKSRDVL